MERRKYKRKSMSMFVFVKHDDGEAVGEVVNASLNGIRVKTANFIPADANVDIHIQLSGTSEDKSIRFSGKVIRKDQHEVAIHLETIDMDSFIIWRGMVNLFHGEASQESGISHREAS